MPSHSILNPKYRRQANMKPVPCKDRAWWKRVLIHNQCYEVANPGGYMYYYIDDNGHLCRTLIPERFHCDLTSKPRLMWSITGITPDGLIRTTSLAHDWWYVNYGKVIMQRFVDDYWSPPEEVQYSKKFVDIEFRERGKLDGVKPSKMDFMYRMVRTFGWIKRSW